MSVRVYLDGQFYEDASGKFERYADAGFRMRILNKGIFVYPDNSPMPDRDQRRMRAYMKGDDSLVGISNQFVDDLFIARMERPAHFVIPELWQWGTIPLLTGQPKAGKSTFGREMIKALTLPNYRLFDRFAPTPLPMDAEIWYINAENPVEDFERSLFDAGVYDGTLGVDIRQLNVEHLEAMGGPSISDVTVTANFDMWAAYFLECIECRDTGKFSAPSVVIVDGLTAILRSDTDRYGVWYSSFRELMRYVDVPNALVIGHSTLRGDHSMGGTEALAGPDGLWTYTSNQRGRRMFAVQPRMGGYKINPTEIVEREDGKLVERASKTKPDVYSEADSPTANVRSEAVDTLADRVVAFVENQHAEGIEPRLAAIRSGVGGDSAKISEALTELTGAGGRLEKITRSVRGGHAIFYRVRQLPKAPDPDTKESK